MFVVFLVLLVFLDYRLWTQFEPLFSVVASEVQKEFWRYTHVLPFQHGRMSSLSLKGKDACLQHLESGDDEVEG